MSQTQSIQAIRSVLESAPVFAMVIEACALKRFAIPGMAHFDIAQGRFIGIKARDARKLIFAFVKDGKRIFLLAFPKLNGFFYIGF